MGILDKNQNLRVEVEGDRLVISIGTDVLCSAVQYGLEFQKEGFKVVNQEGFVQDIVDSLKAESEDGSTFLHLAFDRAAEEAIDTGSENVEVE